MVRPGNDNGVVPAADEMEINNMEIDDVPELTAQYADDDSCSESSDASDDEQLEDEAGYDEEQKEVIELINALESDSSEEVQADRAVPLRRTLRETAGHKRYDTAYE